MNQMDLTQFLAWLANSGGAAIAISWIAERLPWYQSLTSYQKEYSFVLATIAVAILGYLGLTYIPPQALKDIAPIFGVVYSTFAALFVGKGFHQVDKK